MTAPRLSLTTTFARINSGASSAPLPGGDEHSVAAPILRPQPAASIFLLSRRARQVHPRKARVLCFKIQRHIFSLPTSERAYRVDQLAAWLHGFDGMTQQPFLKLRQLLHVFGSHGPAGMRITLPRSVS